MALNFTYSFGLNSFCPKLNHPYSLKTNEVYLQIKLNEDFALGIAAGYHVARKARHRQRRWSALDSQYNLGDGKIY
ncbi:hypothetical protein DHD32_19235 [Arenibacter sp. TNZ]|nr:hypothetical protein [Arenibacter sp. TNZ]